MVGWDPVVEEVASTCEENSKACPLQGQAMRSTIQGF